MCDFRPGQLIIGVPNDKRGVDAVHFLEKGGRRDCRLTGSLTDRLERLHVNSAPFETFPFRYHLLEVPPGDEIFVSNELVHNFNGMPKSRGMVAFAQPNFILSSTSSSSQQLKDYSADSVIHDDIKRLINVKSAHSGGNLGNGVTVCVLDSGLAKSNPAYDSDPSRAQSQNSLDLLTDKQCIPEDDYGHGSAISWIIHEIAPGAELVILKVINQSGRTYEWDVIAGVFAAYAVGADVINLSLQFGLGTRNCTYCGRASHSSKSKVFKSSLEHYTGAPIVIAATGNDGRAQPEFPARFDEVVAIGSINLSKKRSGFSNYGVPHDNFFVMPGGDLKKKGGATNEYLGTTRDAKLRFAGTSMACAYASGMFSLYKSANPLFDRDQLLNLAKGSCVYEPSWTKTEYGSGMLTI